MAEEILRLAPATTNIAVVIGASQLEQYWASAIQREWMPFTNRVSFTWLNDLSYDQMLGRLSTLPPRSFIFLVLLMRDAAGVTHNADAALRQIHAVANAPVNSIFRHQLGLGIVGGRLYQAELVGVESARIAVRVLRGEPATNFPPRIVGPLEPSYDERELNRWNISESRLPPGSVILFRDLAPWQRYYGRILLVISALLFQAVVIFLLLVNRARRRRAEQTAREFGGRLLHAQEAERARLARELHDDITQRLALLAIDAGRVERAGAGSGIGDTMRGVREGLVRLSEDVHALSYRLHSSLLDDLGLAEALKAECERFARQETIPCDLKIQDVPDSLPHEKALSLFRVTQEALRNIARHAQAQTVDVTLRSLDDGLQLAVRDDGIGFDAAHKPNHTSLGLSSMSERVRLLEGELDIESAPGHGTTILAWVPLNGKAT
jgi:signal transduction histidine kinase